MWSSIACAEEHGTREESFNEDNSFANVTLRCAASASDALINDLISNRRPYPFNGRIVRQLFVKAARRVYPKGKYVPYGTGNQIINYLQDALVTVHYATFGGCEVVKDRNGNVLTIVEELEPVTEFLLQNPKHYYWLGESTDGNIFEFLNIQKEEAPGKLLQRTTFKRSISGLSYVPPEILTFVGKVNKQTYRSAYLGLTFYPETLLFMPPIIRVSTCSQDDKGNHKRKWDVSMKLIHKDDGEAEVNPFQPDSIPTGEKDDDDKDISLKPRAGWNHFYRAEKDAWERMYIPFLINIDENDATQAEAVDIYEVVDMSALLYSFVGQPVTPDPPTGP